MTDETAAFLPDPGAGRLFTTSRTVRTTGYEPRLLAGHSPAGLDIWLMNGPDRLASGRLARPNAAVPAGHGRRGQLLQGLSSLAQIRPSAP